MTRVSQAADGFQSTWPLAANADRVSMSLPVMVLTVNPSRSAKLNENPADAFPSAIGPEAAARNSF